MNELRLSGLRSDNLLAFLTLLGLLRCLEIRNSHWEPRVAWKDGVPSLHLKLDADKKEVLGCVVDGIETYAKKMKFKGVKDIGDIDEFKKLQDSVDPDVITVLGSSAMLNNKKDKVRANSLCMMFGSGHQNFLARLEMAVCIGNSREQIVKDIHDALFSGWHYTKSNLAFRWDPKEYRPHAFLPTNPSKDSATCVEGACRLAAIGFLSYTCVPTSRGLGTVSCVNENVYWPIWDAKISLATILAIMRHPSIRLLEDKQRMEDAKEELYEYGIKQVMSSRLFWDGKFKNASHAKRII